MHHRSLSAAALVVGILSACGSPAPPGPAPALSDPEARRSLVGSLPLNDSLPSELFASDLPIRFVLEADVDQLKKDRSQVSEERPGRLLLRALDGSPVDLDIQVKTRGNFRLQRSTCSFPPLRLDFSETRPRGTILDGQDKLKLVTHCRENEAFAQNVVEEYLAYRIYNQLTDYSFRVQLAEVTYVDTRGRADPVTRPAFLLEDEDDLAARFLGRILEIPGAGPEEFDAEILGLMYLFQYLIGNVDWSTTACHNVKVLRVQRRHFPIPYDFDWSGLVNAPYAGPQELTAHLHRSVREQVYWGACTEEIDYQALFGRFRESREAILALVNELPQLSERNAREAREYIDEFYQVIDDPRRARSRILDSCRRW